jgi:amidase
MAAYRQPRKSARILWAHVPAVKREWAGKMATNLAVSSSVAAKEQEERMAAIKPTEFTYMTASHQAAALAARKVTAVELLDQAIARIEALDGAYNAVVVRDFDRAHQAAKAADDALAKGERKPLLGVPMTVKESYNVAGLVSTWGYPDRRNNRATEDAVAVQRLKGAGAIIMGKTNVPISLADWQSYNDIYGQTNNPWNPAMSPGGSSGGSAASVAAGYSALELGSDIGGSVRVPAHFCGLFGHKPTYGIISYRGHSLIDSDRDPDVTVAGPLARSADDLALALDILAGPDPDRTVGYRLELPAPRQTDLKSFRILLLDEHPLVPTDATVRDALERLAGRLTKAGATVTRAGNRIPDLVLSARTYLPLLLAETTARIPADAYAAVQKRAAALSPSDNSMAAAWLRACVMSHRDWIETDFNRAALRRQWRKLFQEWDVVLAPPFSTPAFPHDHIPDQADRRATINGQKVPYTDQILWPGLASMLMLPATVVPLERTAAGLPVGVQIIGPYLEDRTTIEFARLIERAFGGFVPPPALA